MEKIFDFGIQLDRLELKYLIDEEMARSVRSFISPFCQPDPYNSEDGGYDIYSLYLDTPSHGFYRAKIRNEPDRIKLRIRTYSSSGYAHLEVKRKVNEVISKTRAVVERGQISDAVRGFAKPIHDTPMQRKAQASFTSFLSITGADPVVLIWYQREAYVSSVDRYARITFDRKVAAQRVTGWELEGEPDAWCSLAGDWLRLGYHSPVLLELKCETRFPGWMSDLIQLFDLNNQGFSKYCQGVNVTTRMFRGLDASPGPRGPLI